MGQPVKHFEVVGRDGEALQSYYAEMFGWEIDSNNPIGYGIVNREDNVDSEGVGIGGGIFGMGEASQGGHVTFYVEVPDVEEALQKAETLGGKRIMGPESPAPGTIIGQFSDPEGHTIGVMAPDGQ